MNVYQKLQAARIKLQNTQMKKSGHNKFAGYQYFELGDFLPEIQTLFNELGLCGVVSFKSDYAQLTIFNTDKPDERIEFTSPMAEAQLKGCHPIQNLGAVETYSRRYLWVAAMEIVEHDAVDSSPAAEPTKKTISATDGALDSLSKADAAKAQKLAMHIAAEHAAGNEWGAFEAWDTTDLDNDAKVAVWSLLHSKVRSTIKAMKAEADKQVTA